MLYLNKNSLTPFVTWLPRQVFVYSLENPNAYIDSSIVGFMNVLEACRHNGVKNLSYASSSSMYGLNEQMPFSTSHSVNNPGETCTRPRKSLTNSWRIHTRICTAYNALAYGFLLFMAPGAGPTWHLLFLPKPH